MISVQDFHNELKKNNIDFFCGVPDSLLKDFCAFVEDTVDKEKHCIAVNEGSAVGIASGYYLATGKTPLVYLQNSGLGNAINPLTSLADKEVYSVPLLLMIGWRGETGVPDEPQHIKMGKITPALLEVLDIPFVILSNDVEIMKTQLSEISLSAQKNQKPHAIIVQKNTFSQYKSASIREEKYSLSRERALEIVLDSIEKNSAIVSTTGKLSRELFEIRQRRNETSEKDFLTVGSMGHASQIALGISLAQPERMIYCLDGDGAALMHLGSWSTIGEESPANFVHIIFNNGAHESVGGQPTAGFWVDFQAIAQGCKYSTVQYADKENDIKNSISKMIGSKGPHMLEIRIKNGARGDLGRPTKSPIENRQDFQRYLQS